MASADLKVELNCSICQEIFTDPVTLPCGHSFCIKCICRTWDKQEEKESSCPECRHKYRRRPELRRNPRLSNIVEHFLLLQTPQKEPQIFCTFCINSLVPATKSCHLCEVSLCEDHLSVHSRSSEHVMTDTNTFFESKKCSSHEKPLVYYCMNDGACICVFCWMVGEHRGHKLDELSEVLKRKKLKLRTFLEALILEEKETGKSVEVLQERRANVQTKAAREKEWVPEFFCDIRERLEALEMQVQSEISNHETQHSFQVSNLIHKLQLKKDRVSTKIHHIKEICNSNNPLIVLQDEESDEASMCWTEKKENEGRELDSINVPPVGDFNINQILELLYNGFHDIFTDVTSKIRNRSKYLQSRLTPAVTKLFPGNNKLQPRSISNSFSNICSNVETLQAMKTSASLSTGYKTEGGATPKTLAKEPRDLLLNAEIAANNGDMENTGESVSFADMTITSSKVSLGSNKNTHSSLSPQHVWKKILHKPAATEEMKNILESDKIVVHSPISLADKPKELFLNTNTGVNNVTESEDKGLASCSDRDQCHTQTPERFQGSQGLITRSLPPGLSFRKMEDFCVGVGYGSKEVKYTGNNDKSLGLHERRK